MSGIETNSSVDKSTDENLLEEMMDGVLKGRVNGGLYGVERERFKDVCKEIGKRKLLKR